MSKFTKILFTSLVLFVFTIGYSTTTNAESVKQKEVRLIAELTEKIENLGESPIKKSPIKHNLRKKYIAALEEQLEKLEKEKGIKEKKQALMDDLINQIKELDPDAKPVIDESADDLSDDEDINWLNEYNNIYELKSSIISSIKRVKYKYKQYTIYK